MPVKSPLRSRDHPPFGLIETLRFEPGHGCIRMERHLNRLTNSAAHFGKALNKEEARQKLSTIQSPTPLRVRLFLRHDDHLTLTTHAFTPVTKTWTVAIAATQLNSANKQLAHKTDLRQTYESARAEFDAGLVDEVLLTNEHGALCEGTITNLFVQKGGILLTPPLSNGLLRGVLREELLDEGKAIEAQATAQDLATHPFFVGNSLRGLIPARLLESQ
jgi:4-amino-4-deoxychorismate lyase